MDLEKRWALLWKEAAPNHIAETFASLAKYYSEEGRAYHNLDHISQCLRQLDLAEVAYPLAVEAALFYHDVIYDPMRKDNEEQSTVFALRQMGKQLNTPLAFQHRVSKLIIATKHNQRVVSADEQTIVDIDLHTLGGCPQEYQAYAKAIRTEFCCVPEPDYVQGRTAVLQAFLDRPRIYYTDQFYRLYEKSARQNLTEEIGQLNQL